jgi:hypothetical protein
MSGRCRLIFFDGSIQNPDLEREALILVHAKIQLEN